LLLLLVVVAICFFMLLLQLSHYLSTFSFFFFFFLITRDNTHGDKGTFIHIMYTVYAHEEVQPQVSIELESLRSRVELRTT